MKNVIDIIQKNVNDFPDFTVIVDQGENNTFTYRTFDTYARKIAARLHRIGVQNRDFVTI